MNSTPGPGDAPMELMASGEDLQRESERLKLLLDMTNKMVSNLEPRDLLRAISASIRQCMHCDMVAVWFPDAEQRHLRARVMDFPESRGFVKEDLLQSIKDSTLGEALRTGKPVVVTVAELTSGPGRALALSEGLTTGCGLPLISRNRTLGVLSLGWRDDNASRSEDIEFLMQAAGQVAIAIENALAYREIGELKDKLAQEKLYLEGEIRRAADI